MPTKTVREVAQATAGMNLVELDGVVAKVVDVKELPSGSVLATLTVRVPAGGERRTSVPVSVWDPSDAVKRAGEGRRVHVKGRVVRRFWRGDDGSARSRVEVVADKVRLR